MNPSTDVGKSDLPRSFRSHFAEFFIHEAEDEADLVTIVARYLRHHPVTDDLVAGVVKFYRRARTDARKGILQVEFLVD